MRSLRGLPREWIAAAARRVGLDVTRLADRRRVIDLVAKLRPHDLGVELIRVGGEHDGGYLVPDDLEGIRYCFSPGVSETADFEADLLTRGVYSFLADYSVDSPPSALADCHFMKAFIGPRDTDRTMRLKTWMDRSPIEASADLILQMDIEGAEYVALLDTPIEVLKRFRIMVIEFHAMHKLANTYQCNLMDQVFSKLLDEFEVVHIHPNNCCGSVKLYGIEIPRVLEATFLRKDRASRKGPAGRFPHPLDRPNLPGMPDLVLAPFWRS